MRVCIDIATGKIIEGQSGDAEHGTLIANAVASGRNAADVEEKAVSRAEYQALLDAASPPPSADTVYDLALQNQPMVAALLVCINDGTIVPGANATPEALKDAVVARM
jgi:hypothetical protein